MENKFIRLVSTALNVMSTELLRVHSQQDGTISPEKVTATIGLAGTASPVFSLHEELDLSHCRLLKDSTLALFARCSKLEVLSVRKCPMLTGRSVHEFLESCTQLRTLILDGISIEDETLQSIRWDSSLLTHLELGGVR
ncbi:hypothetical protein OS493_037578 [Desmophyllum pertusum]|uniref:F-box/LRR-repeat protein 2 n=1 Tax=Desmophyllum pertusum TaxID=174260 RepID=A0A9W9YHP0_9CNID|nr:hypothetical protein OS493_037578 [Desmophyllum pertusum]